MENASDAMKMAFGMLIFVAALSIAVFSFSKVRQTSAQITKKTDEKEYYDQLRFEENEESVWALSSRVVGVETVIPTLYRYYKENYTIVFYRGTGYNEANGTFSKIEPLTLYYTETGPTYLAKSSLRVSKELETGNGRAIFGFDKQDEQTRNEPWNATENIDYNFMKAFINGKPTEEYYTSKTSVYNTQNTVGRNLNGPFYKINFQFGSTNGLLGTDYKFVERFGEYNYNNVLSDTDDADSGITSNITGSVDILENGEIVNKKNGTTKRVIQYIYIAN